MLKRKKIRTRYATRSKKQKVELDSEDEPPAVCEHPVEILAAIDPGTDYTKAAIKVIHKSNQGRGSPGNQSLLADGLKAITWANASDYVKTQVSYTKDPNSEGYTFRWGYEVDEALALDEIQVSDIIQCFKPAVFGKDISRNQDTHDQIAKLPREAQDNILSQRPQEFRQVNTNKEVNDFDIFVMFIRRVYWFILRCIAEDHHELGLPIHSTDLSKYKDWAPPRNLNIQFAIPLPAASTPGQIARVVAAVEAAGIPNPYAVAEPMSVLAYQLRTDRSELILGKVILIVDIGAGSADIQAWLVVQTNPLRVKQVAKSQTEWVGGRYLNQGMHQPHLEKQPRSPSHVQRASGGQHSSGMGETSL